MTQIPTLSLDCPYFFWNGHMSAVLKKSGVKNAHAHHYRHTLATRLLSDGATFQEVADILGNTAEIVRRHYGKWSQGRQDNIDRLMIAHFPVTPQSHEKKKWCGEGDLFSCGVLKTRKLYTSRRAQSSESARRTNPSHTASHTGPRHRFRRPELRPPWTGPK